MSQENQSPERIYLRTDCKDYFLRSTWNEVRRYKTDVEYIRADLASPTPSLAAGPDLEAIAKAIASTYYDWGDISPTEKDGYRQQAASVIATLPSPAAPTEKGKEDGGPVATLPEASPRVERVQFTSFDDGLHPECDNAEYLEYETRKNTLTGEMVIISYGYRRVWPNGRYEWIKKAEAKGGAA